MPSKNTFSIKPIKKLIEKYINEIKNKNPNSLIIDPFANSNKLADITNDIDPQYNTDFNMDALDFLKMFKDDSVDMVLYDPPFSPRQVVECYKKINLPTEEVSNF